MSSFYSNLVKEDIKNTEKKSEKCYSAKKKAQKKIFKKAVIAGG
jgi:hypothetical protein